MHVVPPTKVPDQLRRYGDGVGVLRLIVVVPDVGRFLRIPRGAPGLRGASRSLDAVRNGSISKENTSRVDGVKASLHDGTRRYAPPRGDLAPSPGIVRVFVGHRDDVLALLLGE